MKNTARHLFAPAGTVRVAPVISVPGVLENLGFDPAATLKEMGYDIQMFANPENIIPYAARTRLLEQSAEKTGCRHFGHLVGRSSSPSSFGITGFLVQQSPDVRAALRTLVRHLHLHVDGAVTYLEEGPRTAFMGYSIIHQGKGVSEQLIDAAVTAIFNILRKLCGEDWTPAELFFMHVKPENTRPFKQYFKATLNFSAGKNGVAFPADWLQKPLLAADPELGSLLQRQIDLLESQYKADFAEQVRRVLHAAVLMHPVKADYIAELFSMHERTMNRRLRECGTCFRKLLDKSRFEIAQQLLHNSSLSVSEIAENLNYTDASAFGRAFRRQSGMAPSVWRDQLQQSNS